MDPIEILYLEDSIYDAEIVGRVLKKAGVNFSLKVVETETEYRAALTEKSPDLILSDHSIFHFNSSEALKIFKEYNYKIPFILVTGTVSEEFAVNILKEGADDYLLKANLVRLPSAITKALEAKRNEREKQKMFENLRILFKNINEVFFSIDPINKKLIQISDGCLDVYGYPPEKFYTDISTLVDVIHPDDQTLLNFNDVRLVKGEIVIFEYRILRPDENIYWVETKIIPTIGEDGSLIRLDGFTIETTRRKNTENELKAKCHDLSTLIYRLAHDIKGPIATTAGLLNLAKSENTAQPSLKYFEMIEESNNRLDKVINGMMQLIRIDAKLSSKTKINFSGLVNKLISSYKESPETRSIEFITSIKIESDFLSDELLMYSLLYNLVHNAVTYRNNRNPGIYITVDESETFINIQIKDNGIGIPIEHQSRIFDIFYRANEQTKGTGLGLYIVKSIVEKLAGTIDLISEESKGTTFNILLAKEQ